MPKLKSHEDRDSKRIEMYSSTKDDPAWIEIFTEFTGREILKLQSLISSSDVSEDGTVNISQQKADDSTMTTLEIAVKDWNYENEDDEIAELTRENFKDLSAQDFVQLVNEVMDVIQNTEFGKAKKKS